MTDKSDIQGEGNYDAARTYDKAVTDHAADRDAVTREAREAAKALDGEERSALEQAEAQGRARGRGESRSIEELEDLGRPLSPDEKADVGSAESMDASDPSSATQPGGR